MSYGGLMALAARQGHVFTAGDAATYGFGRHEVQAYVRRGLWKRLRHGVYVEHQAYAAADERGQHRLHARAALRKLGPDCVISHDSAALLLGTQVLHAPRRVTVTSSRADVRSRDELLVLRAPLDEPERRSDAHGVAVTSPARTAIDAARTQPFLDAVVILDSVLQLRLATRPELEAAMERSRSWRGSRQAGRALAFSDGRAESAGESWTRVHMAELGFPVPEPQGPVTGRSGRQYFGDLVLPEQRTIVEFDGQVKYDPEDPEAARLALKAEKRREDDLRAMGWSFARIEWADLYHPGIVRHKIATGIDTVRRFSAVG